ncbi:intracellular coagulation inhibitor 1-like [Argiope bruennichi]|uniref:intracellular coagulation inhibitor 1-like n=1 Tax=Argiope bruennichi TaxID=94029 RepID=UPI002494EA8C|nr:intracellular coagulation inhibitor 1-like [Argiope bruennichi]
MKIHAVIIIFMIVFADGNIRNSPYIQDVQTIIRNSNELGFKVLSNLEKTTNVFLSPLSIAMSMGLVYSGAKNTTADEIQTAMQFPLAVNDAFKTILDFVKPPEGKVPAPSPYQMEMANAMLVDRDFNILQSYKDLSRDYFDVAVESVSFSLHPEAAVDSVNGWVAWKTNNKITKVLQEPLDPLTKLFLMNVIYFKGTWKTKFDQRLTMPDTFYNDGRIPKTVPMMRLKRKLRYGFDRRLQSQVLELPFAGDRIQMLILLPERRDGLSDMESTLSNDILTSLPLNLREVPVQVTLPRFSLSEEYDLIPLMKLLGVHTAFDASLADLTGISSRQGLYISKVLHKCAVQVNEEGGEAAAVTGVSAGVRTGGPLVPLFTADHPFLFFIQDRQLNSTLFMGRVTNL